MLGPWLKFFHILALILWIGPIIGAWWIQFRLRRQKDPALSRMLAAALHDVLIIEHLGFVVLLVTGLGQLWAYRFMPELRSWIGIKLVLVFAIIIPFEMVDIFLGHGKLRSSLKNPTDQIAFEKAQHAHEKWLVVIGGAVTVVVVTVIGLSVLKPGF